MLKTVLLDSFILFLLVYALLDIATRVVDFLAESFKGKRKVKGYRVLYLQSGTYAVEAAVRDAIFQSRKQALDIILVDVSLSKEERMVAEKLCREYDCLTLLHKDEYLRFVERQMLTSKA